MSKPPRPKQIVVDTEAEEERKRAAEERARKSAGTKRGAAANILSQAGTFGTARAERSTLSTAAILGG